MSESIPGTRVLVVHKSEGLTRDDRVPNAEIAICRNLPPELESSAAIYVEDSRAIADLLWDSLPGGTIDALIIALMQRRASLMRVGFLSVDEITRLTDSRRRPRLVPDECPEDCHGTDMVGQG